MKPRILTVALILAAGLGLAACSSSDTTQSSSNGSTPSPSGGTDSVFCESLVTLNTQADGLVESLGSDSRLRAAAAATKDLAKMSARLETVAELEGGANGARLQVAGKKFEVDLRRIDPLSGRDARVASATSAAASFQSSLSSIATSAQCTDATTSQLT